MFSRACVAMLSTFGLVCLLSLLSPALAQQADGNVRKAATQAPKPTPPPPAIVGTIDLDAVFKGYEKVKFSDEEFKSQAMAKQRELTQLGGQIKSSMDKMNQLAPGSPDFKKQDDEVTQLKARHEALRQQAEKEFALREAEILGTLYKEIQDMTSRVARYRGMTYVLRASNEPVSANNPNLVMASMARAVVYSDPRVDITQDVINYLNVAYRSASGARAPATAPAAAAQPQPKPAAPGSGN